MCTRQEKLFTQIEKATTCLCAHCLSFPLGDRTCYVCFGIRNGFENQRQQAVLRQVRAHLPLEGRQSSRHGPKQTKWPCQEPFRCSTGDGETFFNAMRITTDISESNLRSGEKKKNSSSGADATCGHDRKYPKWGSWTQPRLP